MKRFHHSVGSPRLDRCHWASNDTKSVWSDLAKEGKQGSRVDAIGSNRNQLSRWASSSTNIAGSAIAEELWVSQGTL